MTPSQWATTTATAVVLYASALASGSPSDDLNTLYQRRIPFIAASSPVTGRGTLDKWLNFSTDAGTFSDVDYTAGCSARRANWPAQNHWKHTLSLAAAYVDAYPHTAQLTEKAPHNFVGNATVKNVTDSTMNFWFQNDFKPLDCLDNGGSESCPCGTPGLWNPNWYSNVILVPGLSTSTCMLLNATITTAQRASCVHIGQRGYDTFSRYGIGNRWLTGANVLDIASNGVSVGVLRAFGGEMDAGIKLIGEAYGYVHGEVVVREGLRADGIRPDGSFGQHGGVLYTGNYGKDFINQVLALELIAAGTSWQGKSQTISAFETLFAGSRWMIYRNTVTDVLHWDISVIGRMISFPVIDGQASAKIGINLTQVRQLGHQWHSAIMEQAANDLMQNGTSANAGELTGNRMFWVNDYMVHRGSSYVTTVKMLSSRTRNTECINSQNPLGFHLGQGASYTYISGNEYEDIAHAWDWNLIPGITTDYRVTPLSCDTAGQNGKRTFVGGASDGNVGVAAMDYTNPLTGSLSYRKAWFFFEDDVQHITVSDISSTNGASIYSVLDQKRADGPVYIDDERLPDYTSRNQTGVASLWHDQMGYTFGTSAPDGGPHQLSVSVANRTGNWSSVGISNVVGVPVKLFSAWLQHSPASLSTPLAYSIYPATSSFEVFKTKIKQRSATTVRNDGITSAVQDDQKGVVIAVFWTSSGGTVDFPSVTIMSDHGGILIFDTRSGKVTFADPTQTLHDVSLTFARRGQGSTSAKIVHLTLGKGVDAGKSVTASVSDLFALWTSPVS
ncbi:hypothetical protein FRB93_007211 [Tulasnella sp. JGI-2019a]|nr:hypothetical protein FRB93_007211 [Tulasnella sp. JGI-2019a]